MLPCPSHLTFTVDSPQPFLFVFSISVSALQVTREILFLTSLSISRCLSDKHKTTLHIVSKEKKKEK